MANDDLTVYYDRWQALDKLIDDAIKYYGNMPAQPPEPPPAPDAPSNQFIFLPRQAVILYLLKRLQAFAAGQFQFFYYGFQPPDTVNAPLDDPKYNPRSRLTDDAILQYWEDYPPADILTAIIDQTSHDLTLIQRAADQRMSLSKPMAAALSQADSLATLALQPAIANKLIAQPTTVLTYFEKAAEFYNIPYANVALISIPLTCTSVTNDFLALPHEAGHYVYRNLMPDAKASLKEIRLQPPVLPPYQDWARAVFEEMSADIYGCLVGGPALALDFQELCLANAQPNFIGSDGEHPNPVLRPLIYCQVLNSTLMKEVTPPQENYTQLSKDLESRWNDARNERHANTFAVTATLVETNFGGGAFGYDVKGAIRSLIVGERTPKGPIGDIVYSVLNSLNKHIKEYLGEDPLKPALTWSWSYKDSVPADSNTLGSVFKDNFDTLVGKFNNDNTLTNPALESVEPEKVNGNWVHRPKSWLNWLQQDHNQNKEYKIRPNAPINLRQVAVWPEPWPTDKPMPSGEVRNPDRMEPGTWGYILFANGWATGGPSGDEHGHPLQ